MNFNALPEVYLPKAVHLSRLLTPIGIIVGIGLLVYVGFLVRNSAADTAVLRSQLAISESRIAQQHTEIAALKAQIEPVETQIEPVAAQIELVEAEIELVEATVEATTGVFKATFTSLEEVREEVNADLTQIVTLAQGKVNLTGVKHTGDTVTVSGIAPHESEIFSYARDLRGSGRFPVVIISSITQEIEVEEEEEIKRFNFEFYLMN